MEIYSYKDNKYNRFSVDNIEPSPIPILKTYDMIELTENDIMLNTLRSRCQIIPYGNYFQQTYKGINLLKYPYYNDSKTVSGVTFTVLENGQIKIKGTSTNNIYFIIYDNSSNNRLKLEKGNYTFSINNMPKNCDFVIGFRDREGNTISGLTPMTLTSNSLSATRSIDVDFEIFSNIYIPNGAIIEEITLKPLLQLGNTVSKYEPYVGGKTSPNEDFPQPIEVVTGDNIIILENENGSFKQFYPLTLGSIELVKITNNVSDSIMGSVNNWYVYKTTHKITSYDGETVSPNYLSTTGGLDTGSTIYYELAIPYLDKITNETLITELNNLYEKSTCYDGKTYIHVQNENGNAPLELKIKLLQERN